MQLKCEVTAETHVVNSDINFVRRHIDTGYKNSSYFELHTVKVLCKNFSPDSKLGRIARFIGFLLKPPGNSTS